jgi:hypothetical protein
VSELEKGERNTMAQRRGREMDGSNDNTFTFLLGLCDLAFSQHRERGSEIWCIILWEVRRGGWGGMAAKGRLKTWFQDLY